MTPAPTTAPAPAPAGPPSGLGARRIPLGLRYMVLTGFFFSLMSLMVKLASRVLPTGEIVFARCLFSLIVTWGMLRSAGINPWGNRKGLLVLRGLTGFGGLMCFFYAISRLPLADTTVIQYTNPVFTAVLAGLFLAERTERKDVLGLVLSMAGVVLVARPSFLFGGLTSGLNLTAVGVALLGAVFASSAYTVVRKLGQTEHHLVVVFYFPLVATPVALPFMLPDARWPSSLGWLLLLGVGVFAQLGQVYLTKGLHAERAGRAMTMSYVQIVFAAVVGRLVLHRDPGALEPVGGAPGGGGDAGGVGGPAAPAAESRGRRVGAGVAGGSCPLIAGISTERISTDDP